MRTLFGPGDAPEGQLASGLDAHVLHADHGVVLIPSRKILLQSRTHKAPSLKGGRFCFWGASPHNLF